ncbi:MAG: hypothetical protein JWO85_2110 [Candidatus Eremiobacteraeota bacterium]|nr:hypothetical protein [Candidatus Eremiobacteraeota bacterium]
MQISIDPGTLSENDVSVDLTPTSPACRPSGVLGVLTCTIPLALTPGSHTANAVTYDLIGGAAGGGAVVSAVYAYPFTAVGGTQNSLALALGGVPASFLVVPVNGAQVSGTQSSSFGFSASTAQRFLVYALDRDQKAIVGPGSPQIVAQSTDPAISVSPVAANPNAFDVAAVSYTSTATSVSFTAPDTIGSAAPPASAAVSVLPSFQPITVTCGSGTCNAGAAGTSDSLTASEPGYTGSFTFASTTASVCSPQTATGTTVSVSGPGSMGNCSLTVTDSFGQVKNVNVYFPSKITFAGGANTIRAACTNSSTGGPVSCATTANVTIQDSNPNATLSFIASPSFSGSPGAWGVTCWPNTTQTASVQTSIISISVILPAIAGSPQVGSSLGIVSWIGNDQSSCTFPIVDNFGGSASLVVLDGYSVH